MTYRRRDNDQMIGLSVSGRFRKEIVSPLLVLAVLAIIAYLPALAQPFISDDYPSIRLALEYGPISGWKAMANDPAAASAAAART